MSVRQCMPVSVCAPLCVCVCVCVCHRESERAYAYVFVSQCFGIVCSKNSKAQDKNLVRALSWLKAKFHFDTI